jgi:hypothetical protein
MNLEPLPRTFPATVTALHRVAENVVAPARKPDNEIALMATLGGFGTPVFEWEDRSHQIRVEGTALVWADGDEERRRVSCVIAWRSSAYSGRVRVTSACLLLKGRCTQTAAYRGHGQRRSTANGFRGLHE